MFGVALSPDDLKAVAKKGTVKKKSKDEIEQMLKDLADKNGGRLSKEDLMAILARGDLTPAQMRELAKKYGHKLSKEDIDALKKGKAKTYAMVHRELKGIKKDKGKVSKPDFRNACRGADLTKDQIKRLADEFGVGLTPKEINKMLGKGEKISNDEIRELLKHKKEGLTKPEMEAFLRGHDLGLSADEVREICDKNGIGLDEE